MKIVLNINIRSVLIFDRNLVGGDEVIRSLSFSACCDVGRSCHSAVLRGDHHCDVVWWSELGGAARDVVWWSELGGATRDVVDVVWWSELGGATRDVVDVVDVVGARWSSSRRDRRGPWSTWLLDQFSGRSSATCRVVA